MDWKRFNTLKEAKVYRAYWDWRMASTLTGYAYGRIRKVLEGDGRVAWVIQYTWDDRPRRRDELNRPLRRWATVQENKDLSIAELSL